MKIQFSGNEIKGFVLLHIANRQNKKLISNVLNGDKQVEFLSNLFQNQCFF